MKLRYAYLSLKDMDICSKTRIAVSQFRPAMEYLNGRPFTDEKIPAMIDESHAVIRSIGGRYFTNN